MKGVSLDIELRKKKNKTSKREDQVISEVYRILNRDLFHEKNILDNLKLYNKSFELIDEEDVGNSDIFHTKTIKEIAIQYRLKFIDSQHYKKEIPYEAILKIKHLNSIYKKDLKNFKILAPPSDFHKNKPDSSLLLFAPTYHGNYHLIHKWGNELKWYRKISSWPMRKFETLFITVAIISLIIAVSMPTRLIWLPEKADYWGAYRVGAFLHILIFNMGVTAYITFTFGRNFSSSNWNNNQDF
jgi:hypothetical protein